MLLLESSSPGCFRFGTRGTNLFGSFGVNPNSYKLGLEGSVSRDEFTRSFNNINNALSGEGSCCRGLQVIGFVVLIGGFATFISGFATLSSSPSSGFPPVVLIGFVLFGAGALLSGLARWFYITEMNSVLTEAVRRENEFYNDPSRPNKSTWTYHYQTWRDTRYVYTVAYIEIDIGTPTFIAVPNVTVSMPYAPPVHTSYSSSAPYAPAIDARPPPAYDQPQQQQQQQQQKKKNGQVYGSVESSRPSDPSLKLCSRCQAKVPSANAFCGACGSLIV